jgi:fermentation-respiration switch protein FrsA (DUF1100 family)
MARGVSLSVVRTTARYALILGALFAVLVALLWVLQRRLIYLPSPGRVPSARNVIAGARDVSLETSDGLSLGGWFVPAARPANGLAVLVASGNAGDRSLRAPLARVLAEEGFAVLLFDYRGYGGNRGSPTEEGLARDVRAAYRFLIDRGIPDDRILYFGESLGAAVVTELALEHPPGGLVLRSPFTDLAAVGRYHYPFLPVGALLRDRYPLVDQIREVKVPTTIVFGTRDGVVPPDQSRTVAKAAGGPTTILKIEGAEHNDSSLLYGRELIKAIVALGIQVGGHH